jgi:peptidoglycan/xylan/chitin deacetylase (PgdA/CDA1 family)
MGGNAAGVFLVSSAVAINCTEGQAALILIANSTACAVVRVVAGRFVDRYRTGGMRHCALLLALGGLGYLGLTSQVVPAFAVAAVFAFSGGWGWPGLFQVSVIEANPGVPATALGVTQTGVYLGAAVGCCCRTPGEQQLRASMDLDMWPWPRRRLRAPLRSDSTKVPVYFCARWRTKVERPPIESYSAVSGSLFQIPPGDAVPPRDFVGYGDSPPEFTWPNGARLAVNIVIDYEEGSEVSPLQGETVTEVLSEAPYEVPPGTRNLFLESTFEFGSRVGIWRVLTLLDHFGVRPTFFACPQALELNPHVGHGYRWRQHITMAPEEQAEDIERCKRELKRLAGRPMLGWFTRTQNTASLADRCRRRLRLRGGE